MHVGSSITTIMCHRGTVVVARTVVGHIVIECYKVAHALLTYIFVSKKAICLFNKINMLIEYTY